jgi:hypothetical protein
MKLQFENIAIEKSGKFASQNFDIGDKRVILEILRGKMYSNPIQTICQEIMSNARDAHREIGKDDIPIVVKLPNKFEPDFYIKDFGPGITPDRMGDVFIKYGSSTKRGDNIQAGGFGLGAKSPFSYTDSFSVICVTPENGVMIKRQYIAHIDSTGLGEMSCVSEEITTEEQGTTILITPKEADHNLFREQVTRAATFWPVRPKILGGRNWQWPEIKTTHAGDRWEIHSRSDVNGVTSTPFALVDGVPYPIKGAHLFKTTAMEFSSYQSVALRLHFKIGELPITANREEIDYQELAIKTLEDRINAAFIELRVFLTESVAQAPSLTKALIFWHTARRHPQFGHLITGTTWKSPKAAPGDQAISLAADLPLKEVYCDLYWRSQNEFGFSRSAEKPRILDIDSTTLVVEDNSPTATTSRQRLANLFAVHPDIKKVYLVSFYRKITYENVTSAAGTATKKKKVVAEEGDYAINKTIAEAVCRWNYLDVLQLSNYEKKNIPTAKPSAGPATLMIRYRKGSRTEAEAFATAIADKTVTKYYLEGSGNDYFFQNEKGARVSMGGRDLDRMISYIYMLALVEPKIYLVTTRHKPLLDSSWIPCRDYAAELVKKEATKNGGVLSTRRRSITEHFSSFFIKKFGAKLNEIVDQSCLLVKYFREGPPSEGAPTNAIHLARILNIPIEVSDDDPMENMYVKLKKIYPLFGNMSYQYDDENLSSLIADLVSYVNMKNEKRHPGGTP